LCGAIYDSAYEEPFLCLKCRDKKKPWDRFGFYQQYSGLLRKLILSFKFQGCLGYASVLQDLVCQAYTAHLSACAPEVIVPVPLGSKRLRQRGFNQCLELVRVLSHMLAVPINIQALERIRETRPQSELGFRERQFNLNKAMLAHEDHLRGKRVLLVDDIYTTGSTVISCTHALKKAGALKVDVLVLARSAHYV
jgi:ComF family protein